MGCFILNLDSFGWTLQLGELPRWLCGRCSGRLGRCHPARCCGGRQEGHFPCTLRVLLQADACAGQSSRVQGCASWQSHAAQFLVWGKQRCTGWQTPTGRGRSWERGSPLPGCGSSRPFPGGVSVWVESVSPCTVHCVCKPDFPNFSSLLCPLLLLAVTAAISQIP